MKRPTLVNTLELLLFFVLLAGALLLLAPVSKRLDTVLSRVRDTFLQKIEADTGLHFSYASLSPSLFRSLDFTDLVITDASNNTVLARMADVSVSFDLFAIFRGDISGAFKEVVIQNGSLSLDSMRNSTVIALFRSMSDVENSSSAVPEAQNKSFFPDKPLTVRLQNIDLVYSDKEQEIFGRIGKGSARLEANEITFELESKIRYNRPQLPDIGLLSAGISLHGSIQTTFDSGSASLIIQNLDGNKFSVSRLALITSYRDGMISVSSVQDLQPVDIKFIWDIADKELSLSLVCEKLLPLHLVRSKNDKAVFGQLKETVLTGSASVRYSALRGLEYTIAMDGEISGNFYQGGNVSVEGSGTSKKVDVKMIKIDGKQYDFSFSGSLDLEKFIPEGYLSVKKFITPKGSVFGGEIYIQPGKAGFTCVIPELSVNSNKLSSVEIVVSPVPGTIEFILSANDMSGHIGAEGSFSYGAQNFLQLYAEVDSINVANSTGIALGIVIPEEQKIRKNLEKFLDPYEMTTEIYFSTDLTNLSFSCTRIVLASAEKDGLYVLLSVKGNESGIEITDITFSRGGFEISGNINSAFDPSGEVLFDSSFTVNSIPYSISGMYSNQLLSIYGDYNLAFSLFFDPSGLLAGTFSSEGLPIPLGPLLLSANLDAGFEIQPDSKWKITVTSGSVQEMKGLFPLDTIVGFKGAADNSGVFFDTLTVSDAASQLSGYAGLNLLSVSGEDKRYVGELNLASDSTKETYKLNGQLAFSDDIYFEAKVALNESPLMRFIAGQQPNDRITASLSCSGTPSNVLASVDVARILYRLSGFDLDARGKFLVEDRLVTLSEAGLSWNGHTFSDLKGSFSMNTQEADLATNYSSIVGKSGLTAQIGIIYKAAISGGLVFPADFGKLLEGFNMQTTFSKIKWNNIIPEEPLVCTFVREPGITALYAGKNDAVTGFLLDDGTFSLQSTRDVPVSFYADGKIMDSMLSINVTDFHTDMDILWPYTNVGVAQFDSGAIDGDFTITGLLRDPEFRGILHASDFRVGVPGYMAETFGPSGFEIIAEAKTLAIPSFIVTGKSGAFSSEAVLEFDGWLPSNVLVKTATLPGEGLKVDSDNFMFKASGYVSWKLDLEISPTGMDISGTAGMENGYFAILSSGLNRQNQGEETGRFDISANLDFLIGKKVDFQFRWPTDDISMIRGLVQADKPVAFTLDTAVNSFSLKGSANLKGGEIFYIKRSFYLKEGTIVFNENQDNFDPLITILGEIRERDVKGEPVRIILSVDKQPISRFLPVLRSDPPKPDVEIMALLGQAVSADTSRETLLKDAVVTASDVLTQMSLFRNAENLVRDLFGLDIFSIRTLVLQNAILGPAMQTTEDKPMTVGNYFDNTTVYIGKYFGSAVYADALMHFSYYDPMSAQNTGNKQGVYGNLLIQPELGLEVTTPFFLLRWGLTPSNIDTLFVADNSIRLSWKFSY